MHSNAMKYTNGPRLLVSILTLGLLTALPLFQTGCSQSTQDKASNQVPAISSLAFEDLATPTTLWVAKSAAPTWTATANVGITYILANYAATGGSAVLTPGNLPVVSGVPINLVLSNTGTFVYTLRVTDAVGHSVSQSATLIVVPAPNATITAPTVAIANTVGLQASVPSDPDINVPGTTYNWRTDIGLITSDPTQPAITFTAGDANADGSAAAMNLTCVVTNPAITLTQATQTAVIQVNAVPPTNLAYPASTLTFYEGLAVQKQSPTVTGTVQSYKVTPALPAGLVLDPVLGTITGTPTALAPAANYTVTATNSGGNPPAVLNVAVVAQPTIVFNTPSPQKIGPGDNSILSWTSAPNVSAISIVGNPADATLPATFPITGSANVSPAQTTTYTLTATLVGGGTEDGGTQTVTVDKTPLAFTTALSASSINVAYGGSTTLNWVLAGTPDVFTLTSPDTTGSVSLLGKTSYTLSPQRRQTYTLMASNKIPSSANSGPVMVAAKGLDTLAGNITQGPGNHDGTGVAAQFNMPYFIAADPAGNLYVPDANNHIIRLVTPQGVVSTLAGIASRPGTTDGTTGLLAQFNSPRAVVYWQDASNNNAPYLFVVEYGNQCIRKITLSTSGPITATNVAVFAGTIGSFGTSGNKFDNPMGLILDKQNNLYVTENYDGDVLVVTGLSGATGTITAVPYAGQRSAYGYLDGANTSAKFDGLSGIAYDAVNNIFYVAESYSNRIRKITATTTSTIAGDNTLAKNPGATGFIDGPLGTSRLNGPNGVALSGNILYIADTKNNAVRALDLTTNILTTVIGSPATGTTTVGTFGSTNGQGTSALLGGPVGLFLDASGTLIITESGNNDIRKADTSLNVTTFVGSAPVVGHSDGPQGTGTMAINPAMSTNNTMAGMVLDSARNLYVADTYNNAIRMISPAGVITTIAGTAGLGTAGHADGAGPAASFNQPAGLAMDASGNIYVADQSNSTIRQLTYDSVNKIWNVTTIAGIPLTASLVNGATGTSTFKFPYGIVASPDGNLYVTDTGNKVIRKLTPNGGGVWTAGTLTVTGFTLSTPMGIAADSTGNLYVAERFNYFIGQLVAPVSPATSWTGTVIGGFSGTKGYVDGAVGATPVTSSLFNQPQGVSVDASGIVYVADTSNNTVRKIVNVSGVWTTGPSAPVVGQAVTPTLAVNGTSVGPLPSSLIFPQSVLVSPSGHDLFITTNGGVAQATAIDL